MNPKPIRKAVILTAGLGSRFLPMTKAVPKAMLPIVDKPVVHYLVEEAIQSGIEDVIIVTGRGKHIIEDHFDHGFELETELKERGKHDLLNKIEGIEKMARFYYTRQEEFLGDGHAILCAKDIIGDEPFAVLFGDDIIDHEKPALQQLIEIYQETNTPVICTERVPKERISNYGIISPKSQEGRRIEVGELVEKPAAEDAPSEFGVVGKYICTPEVLTYIEESKAGHPDNEIRLINGFIRMLEDGKTLHALEVEGTRFDTGVRSGLLHANIHFALKEPDLEPKIKDLLKNLI